MRHKATIYHLAKMNMICIISCVHSHLCEDRSQVLGGDLAGVHDVVGWRERLVSKPCIQHVKDTLLITCLHVVDAFSNLIAH